MVKKINKVVNRTGKKIVKKALEIKGKKAEAEKDFKQFKMTIDMRDLLKAGCHLGHKTAKTNPKARENIYINKDGIEIFDLGKTIIGLQAACDYVYNLKRSGKQIVFVGTKRQSREVIRRVAMDCNMGFVTERWLGGTISNWTEIKKNISKLNTIKEGLEKGKFKESTKKELSQIKKKMARLEKMIGGLTNLVKLPEALVVVDAGGEKTAVKEAIGVGIKVVAITDTDFNPFKVDYAIPANDDNVKSISIIIEELGKAVKSG